MTSRILDAAAETLYQARMALLEHDWGGRAQQDAIEILYVNEFYLRSEAARN